MNTFVIECSGLTKSFGATKALDGLDLQVQPGQVAGFLGPNGAGKSTTIRILLGLLRADAGSATLLGGDPWHDSVELHKRIAYVPGDVALWPSLSGGETIDLLSRLRGGVDKSKRDALIEHFEFDPRKLGATYSKGNRQKVALIAALASNAEVFILDEPTSGLDPLMEEVFTACIREIKADGRTVLLSSHILAEVEKLCDTVTIIRDGRTVQAGMLSELRHLSRTSVDMITRESPLRLSANSDIHDLHVEGNHVTFSVAADKLDAIMALLGELGVESLAVAPASLEQLFLSHYRDELSADLATAEREVA